MQQLMMGFEEVEWPDVDEFADSFKASEYWNVFKDMRYHDTIEVDEGTSERTALRTAKAQYAGNITVRRSNARRDMYQH